MKRGSLTVITLAFLLASACTDDDNGSPLPGGNSNGDTSDTNGSDPADTSGGNFDTGTGNSTDTGISTDTGTGNTNDTSTGHIIDTDTGEPVDTTNTVSATVNRVATWRGDTTAAYSIIHDDMCDWSTQGLETHWQELTKRGLRAGFGAIVESCESRNLYPTLAQMINAGHEIINHSFTHPAGDNWNGMTSATVDLNREIVQSKTTLEANLSQPIRYFVFPLDAYNDSLLTNLKNNGYLAARGGIRGIDGAGFNASDPLAAFKANFDCFNENRPGTDANCSVYASNAVQRYLDDIIAASGSGIRELHNVGDTGWGSITLLQYTTHLDYVVGRINAGVLWMDTPGEVMKYRVSRAVCGTPTSNNGVITFSNASNAECQKYATSLSVVITVSSGANIGANQAEKNITVKNLGNNQYAVDINPALGPAYITSR